MTPDNNNYNPHVFWNDRFKQIGHTGYSNRIVYQYDQHLRLKAIEKLIINNGIDTSEDARILDIGCGTGDLIQLLAKKGAEVFGVDISTDVVQKARWRFRDNNKVHILEGKIETLKLPPKSLDLVTSITVLQHIIYDDAFFSTVRNITNLVKEGGYLLTLESCFYQDPSRKTTCFMVTRNRDELIEVFVKAGWVLVGEFTYPQWGIKALEMLTYLKAKLLNRIKTKRKYTQQGVANNLSGKSSTFRYDIIRHIILVFTYFIDYCLSIPCPFGSAKTKLFLFRK